MKVKAILATVALICFCACSNDIFPKFVADESIHLEVDGELQLRYDETYCQLGFSRDRRQFRMCTDSMSDYFAVRMDRIPVSEGDILNADLTWTTSRDVMTRKNIALEVVKTEGDKFWLWNEQGRIALVIRILD